MRMIKKLSAVMNTSLLVALLASSIGCASTATLERSIQSRTGALTYVYDSPEVSKKDLSLVISNFTVDDLLDRATIVRRRSTFVLPLLVFNNWRQEDNVQLGYSQFSDDYKNFLKASLIEEIKRSSKYALSDGNASISLEVRVKKLEMEAPINQQGFFFFPVFFFFFQHGMSEGPARVTILADIRAYRTQANVLTREVKGVSSNSIVLTGKASIPEYATAIMQAVSMAAKDLNEQIVADLNDIGDSPPQQDSAKSVYPGVPEAEPHMDTITPKKDTAPTPIPRTSDSTLEDKLKMLKRTYEQQLITKEEYETKKKDLLDHL